MAVGSSLMLWWDAVAADLAAQIAAGGRHMVGIMLESHINEGNQSIPKEGPVGLKYGVSVTDACINLDTTASVMQSMAAAVQKRKAASA